MNPVLTLYSLYYKIMHRHVRIKFRLNLPWSRQLLNKIYYPYFWKSLVKVEESNQWSAVWDAKAFTVELFAPGSDGGAGGFVCNVDIIQVQIIAAPVNVHWFDKTKSKKGFISLLWRRLQINK